MDRAINKTTGEIVSAFEVYQNGSYQNLIKGEWIAPIDAIHSPLKLKEGKWGVFLTCTNYPHCKNNSSDVPNEIKRLFQK